MIETNEIVLAIGSNDHPEQHIAQATARLQQAFPAIRFSSPRHTQAIGIQGADFVNLVAIATTPLSAAAVVKTLKEIETACGNTPALRAQQRIVLDLDLLRHGSQRFHTTDWQRPYLIELLQEMHIK